MKLIKALGYTSLFFLLTAARCNKDKEPIDQLPAETQEGKGTFGCLIDGKIFIPKKGSFTGTPPLISYYQHLTPGDSGYVFSISAADLSISDNVKGITVGAGGLKIYQGQSIVLTSGDKIGEGRGQYTGESRYTQDYYYTNNNGLTGILHIKMFDEALQIVSGTFYFNATNSLGDTVRVTEGRFDLKYTR